jgi:hypothetical protein
MSIYAHTILSALAAGKPNAATDAFVQGIQQKVHDALQIRKVELAHGLLNNSRLMENASQPLYVLCHPEWGYLANNPASDGMPGNWTKNEADAQQWSYGNADHVRNRFWPGNNAVTIEPASGLQEETTYWTCPHCEANFRTEYLGADKTIPAHNWRGEPCPGSGAKPENLTEGFKGEVIADSSGKWCGNALVFETEAEAAAYIRNLESRWMAVRETRVVPTSDPVTYKWVDGRAVSIEETNG